MYDPVIGRVLSPDNYVQDPTNTQSYNRYSYCLNNPLRYTDPSGWFAAAADQYWNMGKDITDFISFSGRRASSLDGAGGGGQGWGGNGGVLPAWYGGGDYGDFGKQLYFAGITKLNSLPKNDASTLVDWSIDENGRYRFNWADVSWQIIDEAFGFSEGVSREGHSEDICSTTPIQVLGFNLTEAEKKIILSHPTIIYALYKNHNLAFDMTYKYFPNVKAEDNAADAFRHAFFNALNTKSFGTDLTTQLGYAHEFWEGNPDLAFKMDIFNNRIGREIGYMYSYMSGDKLSEIVYNAVRYGQTKMIENGKLVPTYIK